MTGAVGLGSPGRPLSLLEAARAVLEDGTPSGYAARLADLRAAVALLDAYSSAGRVLGLDAVGQAVGVAALLEPGAAGG